MRIILTRGLPASGKTTFARELVERDPTFIRANRDDFRQMLFGKAVLSADKEQMVTAAQHGAIDGALKAGFNVIVDDTNFFERGVKSIMKIAHKYRAEVEFKDFTDVPVDELVRRDDSRRNGAKKKVTDFLNKLAQAGNVVLQDADIEKIVDSFGIPSGSNLSGAVGERVIRDMHKRYVQGRQLPLRTPDIGKYELVPYQPDDSLRAAVIVDIDGTIAKMSGRSPYEWKRVGEDSPVQHVLDMVAALEETGHHILFTSGRDGSCAPETLSWLFKHYSGENWKLYMREVNDNRPDWIIKAEIFDTYYRGKYNVKMVIDDRDQVVRMWRQLGLTVAQVAEGDF